MEINGRRKKSKSICFVVGEVIEINGSLCRSSWKSVEADVVSGSQYKSLEMNMEVRVSQWKWVEVYMVVCGSRRANMKASGSRWKSVEVTESL